MIRNPDQRTRDFRRAGHSEGDPEQRMPAASSARWVGRQSSIGGVRPRRHGQAGAVGSQGCRAVLPRTRIPECRSWLPGAETAPGSRRADAVHPRCTRTALAATVAVVPQRRGNRANVPLSTNRGPGPAAISPPCAAKARCLRRLAGRVQAHRPRPGPTVGQALGSRCSGHLC